MAASIPVKASAFFSLQKNIQLLRNATTYTRYWLGYVVGDGALLEISSSLKLNNLNRSSLNLLAQQTDQTSNSTYLVINSQIDFD